MPMLSIAATTAAVPRTIERFDRRAIILAPALIVAL
jgi:hypothetical protein